MDSQNLRMFHNELNRRILSSGDSIWIPLDHAKLDGLSWPGNLFYFILVKNTLT